MITLEEVLSPENMLRAMDKVTMNKGAPGVDRMTVDEFLGGLQIHFSKCAFSAQ